MSAVAQIGAPITFSAGATAVAADVNSNFADFRSAFNNLVTGANAIAVDTIAENTSSAGVTVTADTTITGDLTVSGVGPHAMGGEPIDNIFLRFIGSFTSGGDTDDAIGVISSIAITGFPGDTDIFAQLYAAGSMTTQTASESIHVVSALIARDPQITNNLTGGGTIAIASSLYIQDAPTEGVINAGIYVSDPTDTTSAITGSIITTGGMSIAKALRIGTTLSAAFPNTVSGTGLMVTTNNTSVQEIMRDSSSARFKENIEDAEIDVRAVLAINSKRYGRPGARGRALGFIVEDFDEAGFGDIIAYDEEGPAGFLDFGRGITALHHAVLRSHDGRIESNEEKIERLESDIAALKGFN